MPRPSTANSNSDCAAGSVNAKPSAAPMNGAVHGEATATASTPVRKLSASGWRNRIEASPLGNTVANSNRPARLSAINVNSTASTTTKPGDCNWKPQPICSPPARNAINNPASATKDSTTPAV